AILDRKQAEDRGAMDDPAMALDTHDRHDAPREIVPAEEVRFELFPQCLHRQILHRSRLGVSTVIEKSVELAVGSRENVFDERSYGFGLAIVQVESFYPVLLERGEVFGSACGGEDAPAVPPQSAGAISADT